MPCSTPTFHFPLSAGLDGMSVPDASWGQWARWACSADVAQPLLGPNHIMLANLGSVFPLMQSPFFYVLECPLEGAPCFDFSIGCPPQTASHFFTPDHLHESEALLVNRYALACKESARDGLVFLEMDISQGHLDFSLFLDMREREKWLSKLGVHGSPWPIAPLIRLLSCLEPSCVLRHLGFMASSRRFPFRLVLKVSGDDNLWKTLELHGLALSPAVRGQARKIAESGTCWLDLDVNVDGSLGSTLGLEWIPAVPSSDSDALCRQLVSMLLPDRDVATRLSCLKKLLDIKAIAAEPFPVRYQTTLSHCKWRWVGERALPVKVYMSVRPITSAPLPMPVLGL